MRRGIETFVFHHRKVALKLYSRLLGFCFLGLVFAFGEPSQQTASTTQPSEPDLAQLLSQLGKDPSLTQLQNLRAWLRSRQTEEWGTTVEDLLELTNSPTVHALALEESHRRQRDKSARRSLQARWSEDSAKSIYLVDLIKLESLAKDLKKAKEYLRIAAARFPENGEIHADLGEWLFDHGQTDLAFAELLRAKAAGFLPPRPALLLASMEATAGAHKDAIETAVMVEEITELPNSIRAEAAALAGKAYAISRQEREAIDYLGRALRLAPEIEDYYLSLAQVHQQNQDGEAALRVLREGHRRLPELPGLGVALSRLLMRAGDFGSAIAILSGIIDRSPDQSEAQSLLAQAYTASGDPKQASQTWRELAQRQPRYPMVHIFLAQSLSEEGAPNTEVLEALKTAEATSPMDPDVYYLRGRVYNETGRHEEAVNELKRAIALQPNIPSQYYQLGLAYQQLGQTELAGQQFEKRKQLEQSTAER